MSKLKIQQVFDHGWKDYCQTFYPTAVQTKAALSIMNCKTGSLGRNVSLCSDCGHIEIHNNSCRNRNCPNCQAVLKEIWIDSRRAEVFDMPYFHVVFTLPAQLNSLVFANQKTLYSLMHTCSAQTLLELSRDKKYLGATPSIIQVLHTWGQTLNFHPHIHCIVSGGGLTSDLKLRKSSRNFFIPVKVLSILFRGKFLDALQKLYDDGVLCFSSSCSHLASRQEWDSFRDGLYHIHWCPYIKETLGGFGNAIDYLGRYTHRIAITNSRITSVSAFQVTFSAKNYRTCKTDDITVSCSEFVRRFMLHVLPHGFQKIRYFGLLAGRVKKRNLRIIFDLQARRQFRSHFADLPVSDVMRLAWNYDIRICPCCGSFGMRQIGRTFHQRE